MSTMANIFHMNKNGIIHMGRFDAREFLKQIRREEKEDLGFGVRYYKDNAPHLAGVIFFGPDKNEIRGLEILESRPWTMVYVNIIRKRSEGKEKFIMKISDALKPDKRRCN